MFKFFPVFSVPEFPGAIKRLLDSLLNFIFSAKACSLPPDPKISIFMVVLCLGKNNRCLEIKKLILSQKLKLFNTLFSPL